MNIKVPGAKKTGGENDVVDFVDKLLVESFYSGMIFT